MDVEKEEEKIGSWRACDDRYGTFCVPQVQCDTKVVNLRGEYESLRLLPLRADSRQPRLFLSFRLNPQNLYCALSSSPWRYSYLYVDSSFSKKYTQDVLLTCRARHHWHHLWSSFWETTAAAPWALGRSLSRRFVPKNEVGRVVHGTRQRVAFTL